VNLCQGPIPIHNLRVKQPGYVRVIQPTKAEISHVESWIDCRKNEVPFGKFGQTIHSTQTHACAICQAYGRG